MEFKRVNGGPEHGDLMRRVIPSDCLKIDAVSPVNRSVTGYGSKVPTRYSVQTVGKRWRRVYVRIYSNAGTSFIVEDGYAVIVEIDLPS